MAEWLAPLADFHFLRPLWLLALVPLTALLWLAHRHRERGGPWRRVIAPALLPLLMGDGDGPTSRGRRLGAAMAAASLLACVALAGPTWERIPLPANKQNSALVILFDLSPSMLAEDLKPNRLTRARLKTIDLLNRHREGSVALVAWAGDAHVVAPLTDDAGTLIALLPALEPDIMPEAGSNPELALEKGLELAMNGGHLAGDILFVTDGFTQQALENLNATLRSFPDFRLSILGVGSDEGAPIPLGGSAFGDGGFARDGRGAIVVAGLGSAGLRGLAERHGGRFTPLLADDRDIDHLLAPLAARDVDQTRALERTLDTWHDRGPWLLLPLLPLMVLAFRRGLFALVLLAPLLHSPESWASPWEALWQNRDQRGFEALENHDPAGARELFRDPLWQGIAAYRAGDFAAAERAFADDPSPRGHYNRGNALARQGKLDEAIAAYREALSLDPSHADAKANLALMEALRRQEADKANGPSSQDGGQDQPQDKGGESAGQPGEGEGNTGEAPGANPPSEGQAGQSPGDETKAGPESGSREAGDSQANGGGEEGAQRDGSRQDDARGGKARGQSPSADGAAKDGQKSPDSQPNPDQGGGQGTTAPSDGPQADAAPGNKTAEQRGREGVAAEVTPGDAPDPALEQWLRRVPDDPGGLLRRKFEFQARQNALEQRQSRNLPPDSTQEERW